MALFRKKRVFVSHSKDVGNDCVRAVSKAVQQSIGYPSFDMKDGKNDSRWTQSGIDRFILRSELMILVLDKTYKGGTRHEYEDIAKYGKRVRTFVFLRDYSDNGREPDPSSPSYQDFQDQKENVLPSLRPVANYLRFKDADDLEIAVRDRLLLWKKERSRARTACLIAALFCISLLAGHLLMRYVQGIKQENRHRIALVSQYNKALDTVEDLIRRNTATSLDAAKDSLHAIKERFPADLVKDEEVQGLRKRIDSLKQIMPETPIQGKGRGGNGRSKPAPVVLNDNEFSVAAPLASYANNIGAGISAAMPSLVYTDGGTNRWTITVSEDPQIKEMPGRISSDPLIVTITFTVKIKDNNGKEGFSPVSFEHSDQGWNRDQAIAETRKSAIPRIVSIVKKALQ